MSVAPVPAPEGFPRELWIGRSDPEESRFAARWHQVVRPLPTLGRGTVLVGFACDAGVTRNHGRAGAAAGPDALRRALGNIPLVSAIDVFDVGNVVCQGDALEAAQMGFSQAVSQLLRAGHHVLGLGGGHEIAYASFNGLLDALSLPRSATPSIGIINLDSHFDLRAGARSNSGTPFRQISERCNDAGIPFDYLCLGVSRFANTVALFERAAELGTHWRLDESMSLAHLDETLADVNDFIAGVDVVYLTICLDVLPPDRAPGVSAPSARGVDLSVLEPVIETVASSGKLRLADIAELNPALDIDSRTARVAARFAARIVDAWTTAD